MAVALAAAVSFLGNSANSQVIMNAPFSIADLARRRGKAHRFAWLLGVIVLAIYIVGMFVKRG